MQASLGKHSRFIRAKAVVSSLSGLSLVKLLLALTASSRPRVKFLARGLLKLLAPGSRVSYVYEVGGCKRIGFLRWKHIDSDFQSAMELAIGDCYRLSQMPKPDFIVDGGSNTGLFILAATARWPNVPIIAFEPVPSNVEAISAHLAANHLENSPRIERVALAGCDGIKRFFVREANQGSLAGNLPAHETIEVSCRGLAQYLPKDPDKLKIIKLDIEGGEVEVLDALFAGGGTTKTIVVMELHNTPVNRPWIEELARRIGFSIEFYEVGAVTAHCQLMSADLQTI